MERLNSAVTHVRLPDVVHERARKFCEINKIGVSEWIRGLIVNALGEPSQRTKVTTLDSTAPPYVGKKAYKGVEKVKGPARRPAFGAYS